MLFGCTVHFVFCFFAHFFFDFCLPGTCWEIANFKQGQSLVMTYWAAPCFCLLDNGIGFPLNQKHIPVPTRHWQIISIFKIKMYQARSSSHHLLQYACSQIPKVQFLLGLCKWKWKGFSFELIKCLIHSKFELKIHWSSAFLKLSCFRFSVFVRLL